MLDKGARMEGQKERRIKNTTRDRKIRGEKQGRKENAGKEGGK